MRTQPRGSFGIFKVVSSYNNRWGFQNLTLKLVKELDSGEALRAVMEEPYELENFTLNQEYLKILRLDRCYLIAEIKTVPEFGVKGKLYDDPQNLKFGWYLVTCHCGEILTKKTHLEKIYLKCTSCEKVFINMSVSDLYIDKKIL